MTEPDQNETLRMPTPKDGGPPSTEGWPGSTLEPSSAPAVDASGAATPSPAGGSPPSDAPTPSSAPAGDAGPSPLTASGTGWAPPPGTPAARRRGEADHGRAASIVFGLILLAIGLWFFAEQTLGLELPRIRWSTFWPVILIGLGVWIVLGSTRRGSR